MSAILWADEDFDKNVFVEVNNTAIPLAQNMGSWAGQAIAGAGTANVTVLQVDNVLGHLGILRVPTGTTSGNNTTLFLARDSQAGGPSAAEAIVPVGHFRRVEAWVRIPTVTSVIVKIGLGQNVASSTFGNDGFMFDYNPTGSANWRVITRASAVQTVTDSGVAVVAGAWYKLTLHKGGTGGRWRFGVNVSTPNLNGETRVSNPTGLTVLPSTNLPTADLAFGCRIETATAAARNVDIDRIRVWLDEDAMIT